MDLQTAVVITAPHEVQALAIPLIQQHTPDLLIVYPAHLTLMYPFVPYAYLEAACTTLRTLCKRVAPFEITLDGYDRFPRVTFMNPVNPDPILNLFHKIQALFPDCLPFDGAFGPDIHPHLTVADFDTEEQNQQAVFPDYEPITFVARRLHVLSGSSLRDSPWLVERIIPLGGK